MHFFKHCRTFCLTLVAWTLLFCTQQAGAAPPAPSPSEFGEFAFAEPYFETVGDAGTIPEGGISAILQDSRGWLWIGTPHGLIRWDGYHFRKYMHDRNQPGSLPGNHITALWADDHGKLWLGINNQGVARFDPATERFTHFGQDSGIVGGKIRALAGDERGGIWIAADEGLDYLPSGSKQPVHYRHKWDDSNSLADDQVYSLLLDHQGSLWVGSANGLQRLKKGSQAFEHIAYLANDQTTLARHAIRNLFQAADGKLWIGTLDNGAAWIDPGSLQLHWLEVNPTRPDRLSYIRINSIAQPNAEQIWLGTFGGGINIVSAKDGTVLQRIQHDPSNPNSLLNDTIGALTSDQSGLLWVATWGAGLQRYNAKNRAFHLLRHSPARPQSLSQASAHQVLGLADGRILVGNNGNGIDILDRQRGLIGGYRPRRPDDDKQRKANVADAIEALPIGNEQIHALLQSSDGALWVGTQQSGLLRLEKNSRTWEVFSLKQGLPQFEINHLLETRDGTLWVGSGAGLAQWLPGQKRFEPIKQIDGNLMRSNVTALSEDREGRLWLASSTGLWVKQPGATGLQNILHNAQQPDSLASNDVQGLLIDKKGQLWLATDKGLDRMLHWDGQRARFEHSSVLAGAGERDIGVNLLEDKQGRIWTEKFVFDPDKGHLIELGKADGMDIGAAWRGAYGKTPDGLFLFGGSQGLAVIDPEQFKPWTFHPPIQLTELKIDGKRRPTQLQSFTLQPGQRMFSVEFSALDFSAPQENRYAYRLSNYEKDWIDTDSSHRNASYSNLSPGQYLLQVRGSNRRGEFNPQMLELPVTILPEFWQTIWFRMLAVLALIGSMYGAYRLRISRLRAREHMLHEMVKERTTEILAAHDDLGQAHDELAAAHDELASAHDELESAHQRLKATQQQMFLQEKMAGLGTLTAGIAHEINNPTNFTHVSAQNQRVSIAEFEQYVMTLFDDDVDEAVVESFTRRFAELQSNVTTMLNGTERIKQIVKDLRSFTRLDEADKQSTPLSECLRTTLNLVRSSWLEKVEFITDFADDPPYECWPALLNQVFMNLLVNGCQAIEARQKQTGKQVQGKLWLRLHFAPGELVVEFEDNGIGITPEIQARILEPFFTTKDVGSGTGLGLSISYGIIQKHNATLSIDSTPGSGSCFAIHFPFNS